PHVNPDLQAGIKRLGGAPAETAPTRVAAATARATPAKQDETAKLLAVFAEIEKKVRDGQVDEAQKQLLQMVEKDAKLARAWYLLGVTHEKKGDLDQAGVAYRQASYLKDPDAEAALRQINTSRVQPMLEEGDRAAKENNWVKAASSYREAVSIAPNLPLVHKKLAEALRQLGDAKEADRELKKAAELEK
ncbi:MAG TPA: tetratricopeptide repeat protein, partial [Candidatus Obscuribacterales bacterium]